MPVMGSVVWSPGVEVPWNRSVVAWAERSAVVSEIPAVCEVVWVVVQVVVEEVQE